MNNIQRRFLLFLVGCIGTRSLFVYLAATLPPVWLKLMASVAAAISLGFAIIYVGGFRKSGLETGGKPIWWNDLRPIHAILYALFAYFAAFSGNEDIAWKFLLVDVIIGFISFLYFHTSNGHLEQLLN